MTAASAEDLAELAREVAELQRTVRNLMSPEAVSKAVSPFGTMLLDQAQSASGKHSQEVQGVRSEITALAGRIDQLDRRMSEHMQVMQAASGDGLLQKLVSQYEALLAEMRKPVTREGVAHLPSGEVRMTVRESRGS